MQSPAPRRYPKRARKDVNYVVPDVDEFLLPGQASEEPSAVDEAEKRLSIESLLEPIYVDEDGCEGGACVDDCDSESIATTETRSTDGSDDGASLADFVCPDDQIEYYSGEGSDDEPVI